MSTPYLTYDNDCSVCTLFANIFRRLLNRRIVVVSMGDEEILQEGISKIGEDEYWKSFHIVKNGKWYSEERAIVELSEVFPIGPILKKIVSLPPVLKVLVFVLRHFQRQRKSECKVV